MRQCPSILEFAHGPAGEVVPSWNGVRQCERRWHLGMHRVSDATLGTVRWGKGVLVRGEPVIHIEVIPPRTSVYARVRIR
jgi:hypothetical protein